MLAGDLELTLPVELPLPTKEELAARLSPMIAEKTAASTQNYTLYNLNKALHQNLPWSGNIRSILDQAGLLDKKSTAVADVARVAQLNSQDMATLAQVYQDYGTLEPHPAKAFWQPILPLLTSPGREDISL
jgi:hypothetical protein